MAHRAPALERDGSGSDLSVGRSGNDESPAYAGLSAGLHVAPPEGSMSRIRSPAADRCSDDLAAVVPAAAATTAVATTATAAAFAARFGLVHVE